MLRAARIVATSLLVVVLAGCIGATPREDFDAEVQARGGGLTAEFLTESLDVVATELGARSWTDLMVLSLRARPGDRSVTVVVRQPQREDFVDTISIRDGEIVAAVPLQDAGDLPLDDLAIDLADVALDRIAEIGAEALAAFGDEGAFVDRVEVTRGGTGGDVVLSVDVESDRRTATVRFTADGELEGIE